MPRVQFLKARIVRHRDVSKAGMGDALSGDGVGTAGLSEFPTALSRRLRPASGVAGPLRGLNDFAALALGKAFFFTTRLRNRPTTGRTNAGNVGNFDGFPWRTFADSSRTMATCSTIWEGDHFPGARGVLHALPVPSAALASSFTAS
jgi:hypothetical protein